LLISLSFKKNEQEAIKTKRSPTAVSNKEQQQKLKEFITAKHIVDNEERHRFVDVIHIGVDTIYG
jgi:hypothetical protein